MGEAKRRGTREQRIEQAVERRKLEDAARTEQHRREMEARRARLAALPPRERKEAVLAGSGPSIANTALLAAVLAATARVR